MSSTEILQDGNYIYVTVFFHLELMFKTVSLKVLGLKLVKLDCRIIYFDLDTIKNELDGAYGLPFV